MRSSPSVIEAASSATACMARIQSQIFSLQVERMEEEKQSKVVDTQIHLFQHCIAFVTENQAWQTNDKVTVFPVSRRTYQQRVF